MAQCGIFATIPRMTIALGSDHAGFTLKERVKAHLLSQGHQVSDFGTDSEESTDYPDFVIPAAESVVKGQADFGIVFGGSGNGEAIAANKVKGVRCALCWSLETAELARKHNNANVIAMGGRVTDPDLALTMVDIWLGTEYEGGRHQGRLDKIAKYEQLA